MNRRIKKKRKSLVDNHMSKWKYKRIVKRHCQAIANETRHCIWGLLPGDGNPYNSFLKRRRQFGKKENEVTQRRMKRLRLTY